MARRRDPQTGKLLPEGVYPVESERTGAVTYRARSTYSIGGKRYHNSKTHKTAKAAIDWKLREDIKLNRGQIVEPDRITTDQYFAQWSERLRPDWSGSRYLQAGQVWTIYAQPVIGDLRMQDVTRAHIQHLVDIMNETLAPSSVKAYMSVVRMMFEHAFDEGIVYETPYRAIRLRKIEKDTRPLWSPLQLRYFMQKTKSHRFGPLWAFMIATGCRVSEAIAMKWDALDLENGIATIKRTEAMDESGRRHIYDRTKSGQPHDVKLESWIVDILGALPRSSHVFMAGERRASYPGVHRDFSIVRDELDLPEITLHDIRHSVVSMMTSAGVDIAIIKSVVGHEDIDSTAHYSQTSIEGQQIATRAAAKLLGFEVSSATTIESEQAEGN